MWAARGIRRCDDPTVWLAVAGIIYGVSMPDWRGAAHRVAGDRVDPRLRPGDRRQKEIHEGGWSRVPGTVRERPADGRLETGQYQTIADSARLILHAGVLALSLYVLGYLGWHGWTRRAAFYHPEVTVDTVPLGRMGFRPAAVVVLERRRPHHLD